MDYINQLNDDCLLLILNQFTLNHQIHTLRPVCTRWCTVIEKACNMKSILKLYVGHSSCIKFHKYLITYSLQSSPAFYELKSSSAEFIINMSRKPREYRPLVHLIIRLFPRIRKFFFCRYTEQNRAEYRSTKALHGETQPLLNLLLGFNREWAAKLRTIGFFGMLALVDFYWPIMGKLAVRQIIFHQTVFGWPRNVLDESVWMPKKLCGLTFIESCGPIRDMLKQCGHRLITLDLIGEVCYWTSIWHDFALGRQQWTKMEALTLGPISHLATVSVIVDLTPNLMYLDLRINEYPLSGANIDYVSPNIFVLFAEYLSRLPALTELRLFGPFDMTQKYFTPPQLPTIRSLHTRYQPDIDMVIRRSLPALIELHMHCHKNITKWLPKKLPTELSIHFYNPTNYMTLLNRPMAMRCEAYQRRQMFYKAEQCFACVREEGEEFLLPLFEQISNWVTLRLADLETREQF